MKKTESMIQEATDFVLSLLTYGGPADRPKLVTAKEMQTRLAEPAHGLGIRFSRAEVHSIVRKLRFEGHPILSDGKGYSITNKRDDLEATVASLRKRIQTQLKTVEILDNMIEKFPMREAA